MSGRSRLFVLTFLALAILAAGSPAAGALPSSQPRELSAVAEAECSAPCRMFFVGKGGGAGIIRIRDAYGVPRSCVVPPTCERTLNYPEENGVSTGVATMWAQVTSGVFRGWENCPNQQPDGSCLVSIQDFVNTEYLCAVFTLRPDSPVPPGCPPAGVEPPPPPLDTTPPNTRIRAAPRRTTLKRRATFRFTSTETGSRFQCRLDRRRWRSCRSPRTYVRLRLGAHTFRVRAIDPSGNRDGSAATRRWRIVR